MSNLDSWFVGQLDQSTKPTNRRSEQLPRFQCEKFEIHCRLQLLIDSGILLCYLRGRRGTFETGLPSKGWHNEDFDIMDLK